MTTRVSIFNRCSKKNAELENFLISREKNILGVTQIKSKTFDTYNLKNHEIIRLKIQIGNTNHALLLIKDDRLEKQYSLFDANGKHNVDLIIYENEFDVTPLYLEYTPDANLNIGNDKYNPGYCNMFSIIFIIFYLYNKNSPNFLNELDNMYKILSIRKNNPNVEGSLGTDLASIIQNVINDNKIDSKIQEKIYTSINNFLIEHQELINDLKSNKKSLKRKFSSLSNTTASGIKSKKKLNKKNKSKKKVIKKRNLKKKKSKKTNQKNKI